MTTTRDFIQSIETEIQSLEDEFEKEALAPLRAALENLKTHVSTGVIPAPNPTEPPPSALVDTVDVDPFQKAAGNVGTNSSIPDPVPADTITAPAAVDPPADPTAGTTTDTSNDTADSPSSTEHIDTSPSNDTLDPGSAAAASAAGTGTQGA